MNTEIKGAIFDIDGTLIDSNDAHAHAWVAAFAEAGIDVPFATVRSMIGMGGDKLMPAASGIEEDSEKGERISKRRGEIFKEKYLPTLNAFKKSRDLLVALRDSGVKLAVASSAKEEELDDFLDIAGIKDLIVDATSSNDAKKSKPDPDIVHAALARLDLAPDEVVMVGDTPYDVEAAKRIGVRTIAVRCGGWGEADLDGAIAVYDNPADLLANLDEMLNGSRGR
jgi:HAD superfamily hydrolase (TIGR01509 family)